MSHEIDGVRKEEDRLTATQPPQKREMKEQRLSIQRLTFGPLLISFSLVRPFFVFVIVWPDQEKKKEKLRTEAVLFRKRSQFNFLAHEPPRSGRNWMDSDRFLSFFLLFSVLPHIDLWSCVGQKITKKKEVVIRKLSWNNLPAGSSWLAAGSPLISSFSFFWSAPKSLSIHWALSTRKRDEEMYKTVPARIVTPLTLRRLLGCHSVHSLSQKLWTVKDVFKFLD